MMLEKGARLVTPASERVPTRQIGLGPGKVVANWTLSSFSMLAISAAVIITSQDYQDIRVRKYFIELFAERKHPSTKAARDISMDLLAWPKSQRQRCVRYQHGVQPHAVSQ